MKRPSGIPESLLSSTGGLESKRAPGATQLSPQARLIQGLPAGLVTRLLAAIIDGVVVFLLLVGCYAGVAFVRFLLDPRQFTFPSPGTFFRLAVAGVICLTYLALSWTVTGRSAGDRLMGVVVERANGRRTGLARATLRAAVCAFFPVGLLWCAVDKRSRAVHDILLGTVVVYDWRATHLFRGPSVTLSR